jgi:DNA repair exonuclease SbcCD ATPase subunit
LLELKYITKVVINNFKSHKHTEIEFSEGLNILRGPTNGGKSTILKFIRWVLKNSPDGSKFISWWAEECSGEIYFSDGTCIRRRKTKSGKVNEYTLIDASGNEKVLDGFGRGLRMLMIRLRRVLIS